MFNFTRKDFYGSMVNSVNAWWKKMYNKSDFHDVYNMDLEVHLCGSEEVIEREASEIYGKPIDYNGTQGLAFIKNDKCYLFAIVSTKVKFITSEINYFAAGHELAHLINMLNNRRLVRYYDYAEPDTFNKED